MKIILKKTRWFKVIILCLVVVSLFVVTACKETDAPAENPQFNNTIVNDNSSWATLTYGLGSWGIPCYISTQYVYFNGDSIIGGITV